MAQTPSTKASLSHEERTATEPRDESLHSVVLDSVSEVNNRIRTYRFSIPDKRGINFLPGQWLDVHVPGIQKAGGFTITSSPRCAVPNAQRDGAPYFELAVQKSPDNPAAAWLWQPIDDIVGKEVRVRVGGSFVWPPFKTRGASVRRAVFIAGGVGINPLISIISRLREEESSIETRLLYSTKVPSRNVTPEEVLFLPRLLNLFRRPRSGPNQNRIEVYLTGTWDGSQMTGKEDEPIHSLMSLTPPKLDMDMDMDTDTEVPIVTFTHRIDETALLRAVGNQKEGQSSVFYVCGPPDMTDSIVQFLRSQQTVRPDHVLCEKWW